MPGFCMAYPVCVVGIGPLLKAFRLVFSVTARIERRTQGIARLFARAWFLSEFRDKASRFSVRFRLLVPLEELAV